MPEKKKLSEQQQAEKFKQDKKRKKEQKELSQKLKKQKQEQAIADQKVKLIYESGLAEAYKYFVTEAFKQDVKFNIFEYAAQKILKFQKLRRQKSKKISQLDESGSIKNQQKSVQKQKVTQRSPQKKQTIDQSKQKKKPLKN